MSGADEDAVCGVGVAGVVFMLDDEVTMGVASDADCGLNVCELAVRVGVPGLASKLAADEGDLRFPSVGLNVGCFDCLSFCRYRSGVAGVEGTGLGASAMREILYNGC